jgi:hypothetical protein
MKNVWYCSKNYMYREIVAGHRHRCRCRRYRHSGTHRFSRVPDWVHLFLYQTGSSISFIHSGTGWTGCCTVPSSIKFFVPSFLLSHWSIFQCTLTVYIQKMAGFRDNFEDHRRLLEHLLEAQLAIGKLEQAS